MNHISRTILLSICVVIAYNCRADETGTLTITATDHDTRRPIAVRMHLTDDKGKAVKPPGVPFWHDHFVFDGKIELKLSPGQYQFESELGPEYRVQTGHFTIESGGSDQKVIEMHRFVDMKKEGWWSGELHIHRPLGDVELLMRAEDLHVGPVITWWNKRNLWGGKDLPDNPLVKFDGNRFRHSMAGEDEREGGALLYFQLNEPLAITKSTREVPSPVEYLKLARQHEGIHVDIEKPFWWDMPVWISTGMCDTIGICNNHMNRSGMYESEAWGKPRDTKRLPPPLGNGQWTQEIYYHLLNCGVRIPPSAGSASGVLKNPVGYNRVYVHCDGELTYEKWWASLRAGRSIVTNGPLLRARVNGQLPGHIFRAAKGSEVELQVTANLSIRDEVEFLEIVKDGQITERISLDDWANNNGKLPKLLFTQSGWLLVRVLTTNDKTFRFASTAPFYVEIGKQPRISKTSAQFFVDWIKERMDRVKIDDEADRSAVMAYHTAAVKFWQQRLDQANAD